MYGMCVSVCACVKGSWTNVPWNHKLLSWQAMGVHRCWILLNACGDEVEFLNELRSILLLFCRRSSIFSFKFLSRLEMKVRFFCMTFYLWMDLSILPMKVVFTAKMERSKEGF